MYIRIYIYIYICNKGTKSHADSAAIFIQMIKTVKFAISWFLLHNICMIYHVKVFTKYVRRKSMCPINW